MRFSFYCSLVLLGALIGGCQSSQSENSVVSQRYIHKYGYTVSKEEWEAKNYPGQVITVLRDGVTVTETYEAGVLHGPATSTYPHTQTIQFFTLYNQGNRVKEISYNLNGMPVEETVQLSPTRYTLTHWYADGTPLSIEEFAHEELLEGQYFTTNNEIEARVEKGNGVRVLRDDKGLLVAREQVEMGAVIKRETFHPNGAPACVAYFKDQKLHREKQTFSETGEPLAVEEWVDGKLHGKSTYFKNGNKSIEISYLFGQKNGSEIHYRDDGNISVEIEWENDRRHGPTTYYIEGGDKVEWYYAGQVVTQEKFDDLYRRDQMITQISPDVKLPRR